MTPNPHLQCFHSLSWTWVKNLSRHMCSFPAEVGQSEPLPSHFSSHTVNKCLLTVHWMPCCFLFLCFLLVVLLFKMAPSIVLRCCRVFLSTRRPFCALQRKYICYICFIQAWAVVLLVVSSMLMSQQYILSKVSLNTNSHKTKSCVIQLTTSDQLSRSSQKTNPVFLLGAIVRYVLIQSFLQLYKM